MSRAKNINRATTLIFAERKDFIIIGLTGRTGSGCTSVAELLSRNFNDLSLLKPMESGFTSNEDRKYSIIYNYAQKNWNKFRIIQMRNIITSIILLNDLKSFVNFLENNFNDANRGFNSEADYIKDKLESEYTNLFNLRHRLKRLVEKNDENLGNDEVYEFYFNKIPRFTDELTCCLNNYNSSNAIKVYQKIGNNIRSSGEAFCEKVKPEYTLQLSREANKLIKILRKRNLNIKKKDSKNQSKVLVVIDALRTPYEVAFFKDRYSAFYLFSINTENTIRENRLLDKNYTRKQIEELDNQEYPKKKGMQHYYSQDVQGCIELSDVHLNNPDDKSFTNLKKQLIKYITLIMHPGLVTPTHIETCMQMAYNAKLNSGCLSRQVGAVITDKSFFIRSIGWNNTPEGQIPCNLRTLINLLECNDELAFSNFEKENDQFRNYIEEKLVLTNEDKEMLNGRPYHYCFKDIYNKMGIEQNKNQVHTRAMHAEENAFLQIAKQGGVSVQGGYLFTTASPCELCSKKAYHLGIEKIYYIDPYPGISVTHVLSGGNKRVEMILFSGAIGRAYNQFYTQILPLKDELTMLLNE